MGSETITNGGSPFRNRALFAFTIPTDETTLIRPLADTVDQEQSACLIPRIRIGHSTLL